MAAETAITPLNFNHGLTGTVVLDKKTGVKILFGYVSGLPEEFDELLLETRGLGLALQEAGMPQGDLDRACAKLSGDCSVLGLKILITKSDMPFDRRWFIIGDVRGLIEAARKDRVELPVSSFLYENLLEGLGF